MPDATRPPNRSDLLSLCAELNRLEAKYIVIGGLAMNELGLVRVTEDIDFLIDPALENQRRVIEALRSLPEKAVDELGPDEDLSKWIVTRVNDEITVDLMTVACGVSFAQARNETALRTVENVSIPFASRSLMIRLKQGPREKDRIDLDYLLRNGPA